MMTKTSAEHQAVERNPKAVPEDFLIIEDKGKATEETQGCCGIHGEIGPPPFNTHS